jgi:hypothetical protein
MSKKLAWACSIVVMVSAAAVTLAAPAQDRPGQPTKALVWVENRLRHEAIPVIVQDVTSPTPRSVQIVGTPTVAIAASSTVQARLIRQSWEYRIVTVRPDQDLASALAGSGVDGWEATAIHLTGPAGTTVLLKRPR